MNNVNTKFSSNENNKVVFLNNDFTESVQRLVLSSNSIRPFAETWNKQTNQITESKQLAFLTDIVAKANNIDSYIIDYNQDEDSLNLSIYKNAVIWTLKLYCSNETLKAEFVVSTDNGANWNTLWFINK